MRFQRLVWRLVLCAPTTLLGCTRTLAPPATPAKEVPTLERPAAPPAAGRGQVTLDVAQGKANVDEVLEVSQGGAYVGRSAGGWSGSDTRPVCITPCVANLGFGVHPLEFHQTDDPNRNGFFSVRATARPTATRVALGHNELQGGTYLGQVLIGSFGASAVGTGALLWGLSGVTDDSGMRSAGQITLVVGGVMTVAALVWAIASPAIWKQEASGVQWEPADGVTYKHDTPGAPPRAEVAAAPVRAAQAPRVVASPSGPAPVAAPESPPAAPTLRDRPPPAPALTTAAGPGPAEGKPSSPPAPERRRPSASAKPATADCTVPFTIDAQGHHVPKPECL